MEEPPSSSPSAAAATFALRRDLARSEALSLGSVLSRGTGGVDEEGSVPWQALLSLSQDGIPLLKFGRHGTPHFRTFHISPDFAFFGWASHRKTKTQTRVPLVGSSLVEGQATDVFRRVARVDLEALSFSLIYESERGASRTLDLVCKSAQEYGVVVAALRYLTSGPPPSVLLALRNRSFAAAVGSEVQEWGGGSGSAASGGGGGDVGAAPEPPSWMEGEDGAATGGDASSRHRSNARAVKAANRGLAQSLHRRAREALDVYAWGDSKWGQTGLGEAAVRPVPVLVPSLMGKSVRVVACGAQHAVLLTAAGEAYAFGHGGSGRLGTGEHDAETVPRLLMRPGTRPEPYRFSAVACGDMHTVAVGLDDGGAYGWGRGAAVGLPGGADRPLPTPIPAFAWIKSSEAGEGASTSPRAACSCSASPSAGHELTLATVASPPPPVSGVAAGVGYSAFLTTSGVLFTCGQREAPLGLTPCDIAAAQRCVSAATGASVACAACAGETGAFLPVPTQVTRGWEGADGSSITTVSCGSFHAAAVTRGGALYTWGWGGAGALGHSDATDRPVPTRLTQLAGQVVAVAAGGAHTLAIVRGSGGHRSLWGWGAAGAGQVPLPMPDLLDLPDTPEELRVAPPTPAPGSEALPPCALAPVHIPLPTLLVVPIETQSTPGNGDAASNGEAPPAAPAAPLPRPAQPVAIAAGALHSAVVAESGEILTFGDGSTGALGVLQASIPALWRTARSRYVEGLYLGASPAAVAGLAGVAAASGSGISAGGGRSSLPPVPEAAAAGVAPPPPPAALPSSAPADAHAGIAEEENEDEEGANDDGYGSPPRGPLIVRDLWSDAEGGDLSGATTSVVSSVANSAVTSRAGSPTRSNALQGNVSPVAVAAAPPSTAAAVASPPPSSLPPPPPSRSAANRLSLTAGMSESLLSSVRRAFSRPESVNASAAAAAVAAGATGGSRASVSGALDVAKIRASIRAAVAAGVAGSNNSAGSSDGALAGPNVATLPRLVLSEAAAARRSARGRPSSRGASAAAPDSDSGSTNTLPSARPAAPSSFAQGSTSNSAAAPLAAPAVQSLSYMPRSLAGAAGARARGANTAPASGPSSALYAAACDLLFDDLDDEGGDEVEEDPLPTLDLGRDLDAQTLDDDADGVSDFDDDDEDGDEKQAAEVNEAPAPLGAVTKRPPLARAITLPTTPGSGAPGSSAPALATARSVYALQELLGLSRGGASGMLGSPLGSAGTPGGPNAVVGGGGALGSPSAAFLHGGGGGSSTPSHSARTNHHHNHHHHHAHGSLAAREAEIGWSFDIARPPSPTAVPEYQPLRGLTRPGGVEEGEDEAGPDSGEAGVSTSATAALGGNSAAPTTEAGGLLSPVPALAAPGSGATPSSPSSPAPSAWPSSSLTIGPLPIPTLKSKEVRAIAAGWGFTIATLGQEWMRDEDASACTGCACAFTLTRRRHHCRNCSRIFCSACTSHRIPLLKLGFIEPVRVCDGCFSQAASETAAGTGGGSGVVGGAGPGAGGGGGRAGVAR